MCLVTKKGCSILELVGMDVHCLKVMAKECLVMCWNDEKKVEKVDAILSVVVHLKDVMLVHSSHEKKTRDCHVLILFNM